MALKNNVTFSETLNLTSSITIISAVSLVDGLMAEGWVSLQQEEERDCGGLQLTMSTE